LSFGQLATGLIGQDAFKAGLDLTNSFFDVQNDLLVNAPDFAEPPRSAVDIDFGPSGFLKGR
jgi:hypothetical protein